MAQFQSQTTSVSGFVHECFKVKAIQVTRLLTFQTRFAHLQLVVNGKVHLFLGFFLLGSSDGVSLFAFHRCGCSNLTIEREKDANFGNFLVLPYTIDFT